MGLSARQFIALASATLLAGAMGFFLAHMTFAGFLIDTLGTGGEEEFVRGTISDITLQTFCGLPAILGLSFSSLILIVLIGRKLKLSVPSQAALAALICLISGFSLYVPWQLLLLIAGAF